MRFFDTLKVMKDIVAGGIEAYNAGEKLDALIERTVKNHDDILTDDERALHKQFKRAARAYDDNDDTDKNDSLLEKMEDARLAFLDEVAKNSSLSQNLRDEITVAVADFKRAENRALDSFGETAEKYAETDEQRAQVRKVVDEHKRK